MEYLKDPYLKLKEMNMPDNKVLAFVKEIDSFDKDALIPKLNKIPLEYIEDFSNHLKELCEVLKLFQNIFIETDLQKREELIKELTEEQSFHFSTIIHSLKGAYEEDDFKSLYNMVFKIENETNPSIEKASRLLNIIKQNKKDADLKTISVSLIAIGQVLFQLGAILSAFEEKVSDPKWPSMLGTLSEIDLDSLIMLNDHLMKNHCISFENYFTIQDTSKGNVND